MAGLARAGEEMRTVDASRSCKSSGGNKLNCMISEVPIQRTQACVLLSQLRQNIIDSRDGERK